VCGLACDASRILFVNTVFMKKIPDALQATCGLGVIIFLTKADCI